MIYSLCLSTSSYVSLFIKGECAVGIAWADKAYANDRAHQSAICSNAGLCDHNTGQCVCFQGYTGAACQRSTCPNECSGHGVCATIRDMSIYEGPDYDTAVGTGGDGRGTEYVNWDKDSIQMCECDHGFFGADCSQSKYLIQINSAVHFYDDS